MGSEESIAAIVAILGTMSIPLLLTTFGVGGLLVGFIAYLVVGFISSWFIEIVFIGVGLIVFLEFLKKGWKYALGGLGVLLMMTLMTYILWAGVFNGPTYTYSILLSSVPGSDSSLPPVPPDAIFPVMFGLGVTSAVALIFSIYAFMKIHREWNH